MLLELARAQAPVPAEALGAAPAAPAKSPGTAKPARKAPRQTTARAVS
jgi:hypothetical protein